MDDQTITLPPPRRPEITVAWDAEAHKAQVSFDTRQFKTPDFALAVLEMACRALEDVRHAARQQAALRRMQEAAEGQALASALGDPRKGPKVLH